MVNWIRTLFKRYKTKEILFFSDRATKLIKSHLEKLPQESALIFQIQRDKKGKGVVQVGFDYFEPLRNEGNQETIIQDGIRICFRKNCKEILEGCGVDTNEDGSILVYPRIDLESKASPNEQILIFLSNKKFLSDKSSLPYGAWERNEKVKQPILIESLFKIKFIESIYLEQYKIQIELKKNSSWLNFEEKVSELLLSYLESLPTPMKIRSKGF